MATESTDPGEQLAVFAVTITVDRLSLLPFIGRNVQSVARMLRAASALIVIDGHAQVAHVQRLWQSGAAAVRARVLLQQPCNSSCSPTSRSGRIERMAAVRNTYWSHLFMQPTMPDLVIVVDSDACRQWSLAGFTAALGTRWPWAVITANGIAPPGSGGGFWYEDQLALAALPASPIPWLRSQRKNATFSVLDPSSTAMPFEVRSAFGGLAIYRAAAVRGCRHACERGGGDRSEHHSLHHCIRRAGGRILVHPQLVIEWPAERPSSPGTRRSTTETREDCEGSWTCKRDQSRCSPPREYDPAKHLSCSRRGEVFGPQAWRKARARGGAAAALDTRCRDHEPETYEAFGSCCSRWAYCSWEWGPTCSAVR